MDMKPEFKVGDYVEWKSEGARARGEILKKISLPLKFKTHIVHASKVKPQYFIKLAKTGLVVLHKGSSLKRIDNNDGAFQKNDSKKTASMKSAY
jgi:hypothetical protein